MIDVEHLLLIFVAVDIAILITVIAYILHGRRNMNRMTDAESTTMNKAMVCIMVPFENEDKANPRDKPEETDKAKEHAKGPRRMEPDASKVYYETEEESVNDKALVEGALSGMSGQNGLFDFPEPEKDGVPDHLKKVLQRERAPQEFMDVTTKPPALPSDQSIREVETPKVEAPKKKKQARDYVVV